MARKESTAADGVAPPEPSEDATPAAVCGLTRAEAHVLRRSTPLTSEQFKELGRLAEQRVNPIRRT